MHVGLRTLCVALCVSACLGQKVVLPSASQLAANEINWRVHSLASCAESCAFDCAHYAGMR